MNATLNGMRWVARLSGLAALVMGLLLWTGLAPDLRTAHLVAGTVFSIGLLALFAAGAWHGAPRAVIAPVGLIAVALPALGLAQVALLPGPMHGWVRAVHLLMGAAALGLAERAAAAIGREPRPAGAIAPAPSMKDRVVLITGASRGIGLAAARALARLGATIVMVCRDAANGAAAREAIAREATGGGPVLLLADLSSQASVRALAAEIRERFPRLDVLVHNAGATFARREQTVDGLERTLATNHLAPFLLTHLLMDPLRAAASARVIVVTSEIHGAPRFLDDLESERGYHFLRAYRGSKLANVLFTYELARRLEGTSITANCMSPGPTRTDAGKGQGGWVRVMRLLLHTPLAGSPERGARTIVQLASEPGLAGVTGRYFFRERAERTRPITYDRAVAARLWSRSEQLAGLPAGALRAGATGDFAAEPAAPRGPDRPRLVPVPKEIPTS